MKQSFRWSCFVDFWTMLKKLQNWYCGTSLFFVSNLYFRLQQPSKKWLVPLFWVAADRTKGKAKASSLKQWNGDNNFSELTQQTVWWVQGLLWELFLFGLDLQAVSAKMAAQRQVLLQLGHQRWHTYLIFVIFFTRAKFLENKIYTEKRQFFALNL